MKSLMTLLTILGAFIMTAPLEVLAQKQSDIEKEFDLDFKSQYDLSIQEIFTCEILKIEQVTRPENKSYDVRLLVRAKTETLSVHIGPNWFIENQDNQLLAGDKVEIVGSRIKHEDRTIIIASEVSMSEFVLVLRDAYGYPVWNEM